MHEVTYRVDYLLSVLTVSLLICSSCSEPRPNDNGKLDHNVRDAPLCRILRAVKNNIQKEFNRELIPDADCYFDSDRGKCNAVSCISETLELSGKLDIDVCAEIPHVNIWAESSYGSWSKDFHASEKEQIKELKFSKSDQKNDTHPLLYLIVNFESHKPYFGSQKLLPTDFVYLSLEVKISNATGGRLTSFYPLTIVNRTEFHLSQLCEARPLELPKGSRSVEQFIPTFGDNSAMFNPVKRASISTYVKPCNPDSIYSCGDGGTCHVVDTGKGFCECLLNYVMSATGTCERTSSPPVGPTVQPSASTSNTFSSVMGAFLSVILLVSVAAAIFFGTKYHVFSRIRSRFSSGLSLWPFRDTTLDDQVVMVDPLAPEDDDPPLL